MRKEDKKNQWINVHDDEAMREAGFCRYYNQKQRDPDVWTKTSKERKLLKKTKYSCPKMDGHIGMPPAPRSTVTAKLIIQLVKNNKFDKSTYSFIVPNTSINNILSRFIIGNKNYVKKYYYNGRTNF